MSIDERIAEIAQSYWIDAGYNVECSADHVINAIRAALADPVLRGEIENAALERAARVCEDMRNDKGEFIGYYGNCAAAIRALIKETK